MPISNSYQAYNTDGPNGSFNTTDPAGSFAYWTDPVYDTAKPPNAGHDTNPNMVYSPVPPATARARPWRRTRSPRRRGCRSPGPAATWPTSPRRTRSSRTPRRTSPRSSAPTRPRPSSSPRTPDSFKDAETADYVGVARALRAGQRVLRRRQGGPKFGQTTRVADRGARRAAATSRAGTTGSRRCSGTGTSRRSSARARPT